MAAALGNSEQVIDGSIVAIAVGGARSQRAVRWASENLIPHASRVVLMHVVPPLSIVPSPSGNHTPVEEVGRDVLRLYEGDRLANVRKNLGYFKKLCQTRREVEIVVLVGEDPSVEILRYLGISGIKNLVLGDSTFTWISRTVKGLDVPGTVLRSAPDSCNVFLVSRWKLIFKLANKPDDYDSDSATQIRKTKLKMFTQRERSRIFEEHISRRNSMPSQLTHRDSALSVISDLSRLNSQISTDSENININPTAHTRQNSELTLMTMSPIMEDKIFSNVQKAWLDPRRYRAQSLEVIPSDRPYSPEESDEFEEIERLRMELDSTQIKYSRACKDLIIAKKKKRVGESKGSAAPDSPVISHPLPVNATRNEPEIERGVDSSITLTTIATGISSAIQDAGVVASAGSSTPEKIREERAAIKAQAAFRGYLARRAFRALRGIIRLQALIRGHLVRRQAVATLRCMQAIVKLQALARGQKVAKQINSFKSVQKTKLSTNKFFCKLKARYGGSYVFTVTTSQGEEQEVGNMILRLSPNANKTYHISGTQKFEIPKQDVKIVDVFDAVENAKRRFTIQAWGLADTTLEDVFVKVVKDAS